MLRRARRDKNEAEIIGALCCVPGLKVRRVNHEGLPDLLISYRGRWYLAEVKMPEGRYTPAQLEFARWAEGPLVTLRSADDVANWVQRLPR